MWVRCAEVAAYAQDATHLMFVFGHDVHQGVVAQTRNSVRKSGLPHEPLRQLVGAEKKRGGNGLLHLIDWCNRSSS